MESDGLQSAAVHELHPLAELALLKALQIGHLKVLPGDLEVPDAVQPVDSGEQIVRVFKGRFFVDIPDEPGALAKVTVLLADAGINLKNFGISHNREDEEGVLRLSFYDTDACRKAFELLADAGYRLYNR